MTAWVPPATGLALVLAVLAPMFGMVVHADRLRCAPPLAHALGTIDGVAYTNSREAFLQSYQHGHRLFEADLQWTRDGVLVLAHDWGNHRPPTLAEWKGHSRYTPLAWSDMVTLMQQYPDTRLVLDMKWGPRMAPAVLRQTPRALWLRLLPLAWGPADAFVLEGLAGWSLAYGTHYGRPTPGQVRAMVRRYRIGVLLCG